MSIKPSLLLFVSASLLAGSTGAALAVEVSGGGLITGTVQLRENHSSAKATVDRDAEICGDQLRLDNVITGSGHALKNAIVYITNISTGIPVTVEPVTLSPQMCLFQPRVQVAFLGAPITLKNEDQVAHTFHATLAGQPLFNVSLPLKGQQAERRLSEPGWVKIYCEKHRWESAWIFVSSHPYAAVTDAQGQFTLNDVPPGAYQLKAWHEGWQPVGNKDFGRVEFEPLEQVQTVTVVSGSTATVQFSNLEAVPSQPVH
jgi:plastocyanin